MVTFFGFYLAGVAATAQPVSPGERTSLDTGWRFAKGDPAEAQGKLSEALNNYEDAVRSGGAGGSLVQAAYQSAMQIKAKLDAAPHATVAPTARPSLTPTLVAPSK